MAVTDIPVITAPFQGQPNPVAGTLTGVGLNLSLSTMAATQNMSFINDGYTILYVITVAGSTGNITISSVRDNAGRVADIGPITSVVSSTFSYGPFRPIWWNYGGRVNLSFSVPPTNTSVAAVQYLF